MNGIRFYQEFKDKSKRRSSGTVVAVLALNGSYWSSRTLCYEAIVGLFDQPNSAVAGSAVSLDYLHENCKRVSEAQARTIHAALFERLDEG